MLKKFNAILKNNSIQWLDEIPPIELDSSVKVNITLLEETTNNNTKSDGEKMAKALKKISQNNNFAHINVQQWQQENRPSISALSYLEVLGYHKLTDEDKSYFEEFFNASQILPISQTIITQAVKLKQTKKISLGDAIIAGTGLVYDLTVVTRNINDFKWIT